MRRFPVLFPLIALISLSLLPTSASAHSMGKVANLPASKCTKVGVIAKSASTPVKCVKRGKKLVWQKIIKSKAPSPKPSSSTTAKATPTPSQSGATQGANPPAQSEYTVNVKATQWSYSFSYLLDGSNTPLNSDSSHSTTLFLPQGKVVHILLKSNDVSHGFWIPGLEINKEASPDATTRIDITAEKLGTFPGVCNIQCGRGHAGMKFSVEVISQADYLRYLFGLKGSAL